jgi:hypothetical protein
MGEAGTRQPPTRAEATMEDRPWLAAFTLAL